MSTYKVIVYKLPDTAADLDAPGPREKIIEIEKECATFGKAKEMATRLLKAHQKSKSFSVELQSFNTDHTAHSSCGRVVYRANKVLTEINTRYYIDRFTLSPWEKNDGL